MPKRCVVGGCDNVRTSSISLHKYPVEKTLWPRWDRFVRSTRSDFRFGHFGTIVCSAHFTPEDYLNHRMWSMGLVKRLRLNPTAVPSVRPEIVRVSKRKVNERTSTARLKLKMARQHFVDGRPTDEHPHPVDAITGQVAACRRRRVQAPSRVSESDPPPQKTSKPAAAKMLLKSQSHAVNSCSSSTAGQEHGGGGDNCSDHTLTRVKLEKNLEDDTNPVQVEETERTRHSEPFPVSLIKCERLQDGELASYRYLPLVTDGHPLSDQLGKTDSHSPAFQNCVATPVIKQEEGCGNCVATPVIKQEEGCGSCVATPEIKQEEGCDGKSGTGQCEAWLRESGGESVQKPPLPDEDFRVVLNPDYVKEEALDCQEREEEQESAVPFSLQVKVEPGCSPPATCFVHESQGPQTGLK